MPKVELKGRLVSVDGVWEPGGKVVEVDAKTADRLVGLDAAVKVDGRRSTTAGE